MSKEKKDAQSAPTVLLGTPLFDWRAGAGEAQIRSSLARTTNHLNWLADPHAHAHARSGPGVLESSSKSRASFPSMPASPCQGTRWEPDWPAAHRIRYLYCTTTMYVCYCVIERMSNLLPSLCGFSMVLNNLASLICLPFCSNTCESGRETSFGAAACAARAACAACVACAACAATVQGLENSRMPSLTLHILYR